MDEQVVRELCESLLDEGEVRPPVDVELLASLCGIAAVDYREEGPSGMLVRRDGTWVASVLAGDGYERARFTILHEAGHTLLPGFARGGARYRCNGPRTREEQLCDLAAAELLLPRRFFAEDLACSGAGLGGAEELATAYAASVQATTRRMVDLSPSPAAMLVFRLACKPADHASPGVRLPKLRLQWAHANGARWPYPLKHKSAPRNSAFGRAWEHERVEAREDVSAYFAHPVDAMHVSARRYGDTVLAMVTEG